MTTTIKSSADGTQAIIQVNGVDKVVVGSTGIEAGSYKAGSVDANALAQKMTRATSLSSGSGTSIDFTGIPSWVQRVTFSFNQVSTTGASYWLLQLGSGSIQNTGYTSTGTAFGVSSCVSVSSTAGILIRNDTPSVVCSGAITFTLIGGSTWAASGNLSGNAVPSLSSSGGVTLSGALDRIRLTTVNGTDTFDSGSVNIMYEG